MKLAAILLLPVALAGISAQATEMPQVPKVGLEGPEADACVGVGRVSRGNLPRDGRLPVFPMPTDEGRAKDHLASDTLVWLCEVEGEWQGIVYASGEFQELGDCRVSTPVSSPQAYAGPCQWGWVAARSLHLVTS
ncbi:hypothetical protein M3P36_08400 [Altererythrobacter sp. KTW20L]|uniref:hypothetical protein n=1 Tax=Altererythrobacter sp. KTW20L TaxID=2942210 RepID=UPI0020C0AE54|nr:hypothetical protein [Altererythrobacter sp. KTW20L]MCL6251061.1 hypothetical protein [Altererythrobacter sp. KTW20L]